MSEAKKIRHISHAELTSKGVSALGDRPNTRQQYGTGGFSSTELKAWFDNLAVLIAARHNELLDILASPEAADHIGVESGIEDIGTLADYIRAMRDGTITDQALLVKLEGSTMTVQAAVDEMVSRIGNINDTAFTNAYYDEEERELVFTTASEDEVRVPATLGGGGTGGGTNVVANPTAAATQDLQTVRIGDTVYSIGNPYALAKGHGYEGTEADFGAKMAELLALEIYGGEAEDLYTGETEDIE